VVSLTSERDEMKIKEIIQQHRRDFTATLECENCNHLVSHVGYDDDNYHENVIPQIQCPKCGEVAPDSYRPLKTKYPANQVV
jgi:uncharacterized Zn finger protein